jgi:hypothetical protein
MHPTLLTVRHVFHTNDRYIAALFLSLNIASQYNEGLLKSLNLRLVNSNLNRTLDSYNK